MHAVLLLMAKALSVCLTNRRLTSVNYPCAPQALRVYWRALRRARCIFACSSITRYDSDATCAVCNHAAASIPKAVQYSNAIGDPAFKTGNKSATDSLPCWGGTSPRLQRRTTCGSTSRRTNRSARRSGLGETACSREEDVVGPSTTASESVRSDLSAACTVADLADMLSSVATIPYSPPASCWSQ